MAELWSLGIKLFEIKVYECHGSNPKVQGMFGNFFLNFTLYNLFFFFFFLVKKIGLRCYGLGILPASLLENSLPGPKWHNSTVYRNIHQFITVLEICRNLPLFGYSNLGNSSFPWYSSFMNSNSIKNFPANLITIFSKNSSLWNSSIMENLSFSNLSTQKVVDSYIFSKQW